MPAGMAGCLMYQGAPLPVLDLLDVLEPQPKGRLAARVPAQIVVMAPSNGVRFGLMVDDLGEIAEVLTERLMRCRHAADQGMFADQALAPTATMTASSSSCCGPIASVKPLAPDRSRSRLERHIPACPDGSKRVA